MSGANFTFLRAEFADLFEASAKAESPTRARPASTPAARSN